MTIQGKFLARGYNYDTLTICTTTQEARQAIEQAARFTSGGLSDYFAVGRDERSVYVYLQEVTLRSGEQTVLQVEEPTFSKKPRRMVLEDVIAFFGAVSVDAPLYVMPLESYRVSAVTHEDIQAGSY